MTKISPRTKTIICVDWAGYPYDLDELLATVHHYGINLICDAVHIFGSQYKVKYVGGIVNFTCFSF